MSWEVVQSFNQPESQPSSRRAHTASAVGDVIVVFGGRGAPSAAARAGGGGDSSQVALLDTTTMTWSCPTRPDGSPLESTPTLRWNHTAAVIGRSMYIFGGENDQTLHADLLRFDVDLLRWEELRCDGKPPCARYAHSACAYERRMVVFGGSSQSHLNDVCVFDSEAETWEEVETAGDRPSPRCGHASAALDDSLWVFGGLSQNFRNDLHALDLRGMVWRQVQAVTGVPPSIRGHLTATRVGSSIVFFGGWNGGKEGSNQPQLMNDVHVLSVCGEEGCRWREPWLQGRPPCPRNTHTASLVGDRIYILGGWDRKTCFDDLYVLDAAPILDHELAVGFAACMRQRLFNKREFSDVSFVVGDRAVHAHRCVLAARSDFFASLFASGMRESQSPSIEVASIAPDHTPPSYAAFSSFIEYLYAGAPPSDPALCVELLCLADYYGADGLRRLCDQRARCGVRCGNVAELIAIADRLKAHELLEFYISYVVGNYKEVQPSLRDLSGSLKDAIMERLVHKLR